MSDVLNDTDFDALAAEYVLGTLDASERAHTHVLLGIDDGFAARVKTWERRLGELHLMVEPVEPDWQVWERVKTKIGGFHSNPFYVALGARGTAPEPPQPLAPQDQPTPGLWDPPPAEPAPPAPPEAPPEMTAAAPATSPTSLVEFALQPHAELGSPELPAPAPSEPAAAEPTLLVPAGPEGSLPPAPPAALESPAVAAPALVTPLPDAPAPIAQVPQGERTIPLLSARRELAPAAPAADDARWRRSVLQWRALALLMTVVALVLGGFVAALRNFPDRLPTALRLPAQLTAAGPNFFNTATRRPAPPESQFDE
jgi:hypothetical protein